MILRWHSAEQLLGGCCAFCAVVLSGVHIVCHLRWNNTKLWRCTCRILLVVPIYSCAAFGSLLLESRDFGWAELLTLFREVYESMAIVSFMQFLLNFLRGPRLLAEDLREKQPEPFMHPFPLSCILPAYRAGPHFVACVVLGVLQYIPVMLLVLLCNFGLWVCSEQDITYKWLLGLTIVPKIAKGGACALAMYHLALFYHKVHDELSDIRPLLKFMGIKGIVFFTFWQELVILILVRIDVIPPNENNVEDHIWGQMQIADGLKNFLLCVEMLLFAELHRRAYPYDPYEEVEATRSSLRSRSLDNLGGPAIPERAFKMHTPGDLVDLYLEVTDLLHEARQERRSSSALEPPGNPIEELNVELMPQGLESLRSFAPL